MERLKSLNLFKNHLEGGENTKQIKTLFYAIKSAINWLLPVECSPPPELSAFYFHFLPVLLSKTFI
jgi:hypothetical protein